MLFHTQLFILVFLPVVVAFYYAVAALPVVRQWVLVAGSLVFYGWWDVRFVPLLLGHILVTWMLALLSDRLNARWPLIIGVALNLFSLATFKYLDFFVGAVEAASGVALSRSEIVLPIGISFFSFQLISYLVDRMRNDAPIYQLRPFALFILLFPHLIAGPIVRHNELVPQFDLDPMREGLWRRIGLGLFLFTMGVTKKVLLADQLAAVSDPLFAAAQTRVLDLGEAWSAALSFTFQLFMDFSAYTEMAIGIALLFGLTLPENFRRPYLAADLREFWRRWHMSLSLFLRDYLYIPLGGSRNGVVRTAAATLLTMTICGLWHGAGWTYVVWGLWHGVGLVIYRVWSSLKRPMPAPAGWMLTMLFVIFGWVLFRAPDFTTAASIAGSMLGFAGISGALKSAGLISVAAVLSVAIPSAHQIMELRIRPRREVAIVSAIVLVVCLFQIGKGTVASFIYFQF